MKENNTIMPSPQGGYHGNTMASSIFSMLICEFGNKIKSSVYQAMDEWYVNHTTLQTIEIQTLSSKELCERWHCSKNTLHNRESEGIITPTKIGGRKKVYLMKDILECEATYGYCK